MNIDSVLYAQNSAVVKSIVLVLAYISVLTLSKLQLLSQSQFPHQKNEMVLFHRIKLRVN